MSCSSANRLTAFICGVVAIAIVDGVKAEMCKWVDKDGCVHYAETCPEGIDGIEIEIQPRVLSY
jgi:hypothetical protein